MRRSVLTILLFMLAGCAGQQVNAYKAAVAEPIDVWKQKISISDDPLETTVVYSTEGAITDMKNVFTGEAIDTFVRGVKDKQSGIASLQGYIYISMINGSWPRPYQINYGNPLRTSKLNEIGTDVDCSGSRTWGGCRYTYHLTFPVPLAELERLSDANYSLEQMSENVWKFRLKFQAYEDFNHVLSVQELLSIYEVMQEDGAFFAY